jgi:ABC-type Fe3+ transport system substrate-binding protein
MTRTFVAVMLVVSMAAPAAAQTLTPHVNFQQAVSDHAIRLAAIQTPTSSATPPPQPQTSSGPLITGKDKTIYGISLAAAAFGTIFNIIEVRDALDHHLKAKTFPLVWQDTSDPKDKGKLTATIAATNGGLMVVSAIAFKRGNPPIASFINFLVGGATTIVALHDRQVINDAK